MLVREKKRITEAVKFNGRDSFREIEDLVIKCNEMFVLRSNLEGSVIFFQKKDDDKFTLNYGEWLIGIYENGESILSGYIFKCSNDEFQEYYEPVGEP